MAGGARQSAACGLVGIDERTIQRWRAQGDLDDKRRGPKSRPANSLSSKEETQILELVTSDEFSSLSPHQLVAKLADMGMYLASESTIYRLLRRRKLLRHRDATRPRTQRRPRQFTARGPNQVWAWDITYLPSLVRGRAWYLYSIIDVWSRKIVGWDVHDMQTDELAAHLISRAKASEQFDRGLVLHADNGKAMRGKTMLVKLEELGVIPSFSRTRVSDDNPFPEALFRTMKYRPNYPEEPFATAEDARRWVSGFVHWYNEEHQHSAIRFVTPCQRHDGRELRILDRRRHIYERARRRRPDRWTRQIRNWTPIATVFLNPEHGLQTRQQP